MQRPIVFCKRLTPIRTVVYDTYWRFAAARQRIFFSRLADESPPWTSDPILQKFKFTNAYRASDRVSQYLIRNVIYSREWSFENIVFRVLLFKLFNKIETWELLESEFQEINLSSFDVDKYDKVLERARAAGTSIYSAAYIMPTAPRRKKIASRKHRSHFELLDSLKNSKFFCSLQRVLTLSDTYKTLLEVESFGAFLAYQLAIDLNYSPWFNFSESEYVVPGPGARDGIQKVFSDLRDYSEVDAIEMMRDRQNVEFQRLDIKFHSLWGRPLQLIDCQNLFCEVDKYSRVAHPRVRGLSGRSRIKRRFTPSPRKLSVWYPPKWGINKLIQLS